MAVIAMSLLVGCAGPNQRPSPPSSPAAPASTLSSPAETETNTGTTGAATTGAGSTRTGADTQPTAAHAGNSAPDVTAANFQLEIEDTYRTGGRVVLTGRVRKGVITPGTAIIVVHPDGVTHAGTIAEIKVRKTTAKSAKQGDDVQLYSADLAREAQERGAMVIDAASAGAR